MKRYGMLLVLLGSAAHAGQLHRCVGPDRSVSYQSVACAAGHRTDRTIAFTPDPVAPVAAQVRRVAKPMRPTMRQRPRRESARAPRVDACAQAKAKREQALSRLGLQRTYDQLSRLDWAVRAACNGW
ncbi:MAG TPA: hypothetical protein VN205_07665 [Thermomonas sp.]|nr:hypothetical protein [Thermomonas sp.]